MNFAVLSNDELSPWINWTTLGPPLLEPLSTYPDAYLLRPLPLAKLARGQGLRALVGAAWSADMMFWMQGSSRPELPLSITSMLAGRARRAAFVVDPWRSVLGKLALAAKLQKLDPLFVSFREAYFDLKRAFPTGRFDWLPFGVDTRYFHPRPVEKDVFIFWMGRRYEPLHKAILEYCQSRRLDYVFRREGQNDFLTPEELAVMTSRAEYFVATPPDLDNAVRSGGYSPLVMRYMEGLAAGTRILGVLPRSGEYQSLLPTEAMLTVAADGSDLAKRLDADRENEHRYEAVRRASDCVLKNHSWQKRAEQIYERLLSGKIAFPV